MAQEKKSDLEVEAVRALTEFFAAFESLNLSDLIEKARVAKEAWMRLGFAKLEGSGLAGVSFTFSEPLQKGKGFEKTLLKALEGEAAKHKDFEYEILRNHSDEIIGIKLHGSKEHIDHVLRVCQWIEKKLGGSNK